MCPTRGAVFRGCFAGGEDINLLFIYFEGFNEGMIGREAEMRGFMVKRGTGQLEGGGRICAISVRISMNNGTMETVEYTWVDLWCMLDWIIGLCHKTVEVHFSAISCSTGEAKIRTPCKASH